jgi:AAA+ ATPase superfamily predicted ATPase
VSHEPERRKLIVIDEFQYIGKSSPAFPSVFQRIWDLILQRQNVMVVLCGSLISLMESQTLSYGSPLYGRRTGQIKLGPIPFRHYGAFYEGRSEKEWIPYYSVTGGVPRYIEMFGAEDDVYAAIEKHILAERGFLYEEPIFLLRSEVTEIGSYFSLIRAIAAGNQKLNAIASDMGVKQTGLTRYLRTLIDLDILERQTPVTEENPEKSKRGLYRIKDHFIDFWFKFVYPERASIEIGRPERALRNIRKSFASRHVSYVYEEICRERLREPAAEETLPFRPDRAGRWWDNKREIDIVATDAANSGILFAECKYTASPMDTDIFFALREKAKAVPRKPDGGDEYFAFFCTGGYTERMRGLAADRKDIFLFE